MPAVLLPAMQHAMMPWNNGLGMSRVIAIPYAFRGGWKTSCRLLDGPVESISISPPPGPVALIRIAS